MFATCTWTIEPDPNCEFWETECGNAFQFESDGPDEHKFKFCCYCGGQLVVKIAEVYTDDDDNDNDPNN